MRGQSNEGFRFNNDRDRMLIDFVVLVFEGQEDDGKEDEKSQEEMST